MTWDQFKELWVFVGPLLGSLVGAGAALGGQYVQVLAQARRDRAKLAFDAAVKDLEIATDLVKRQGGGQVNSLPSYLHLYMGLVELMDRGKLEEGMRDLYKANERIRQATSDPELLRAP